MENNEQDRSEKPSSYKLMQARRKGSVARGMDLGFMASLAAFLGYIWVSGADLAREAAQASRVVLASGGEGAVFATLSFLFSSVLRPMAVMAGVIFLTVLLFEVVQTGVVFSAQPLKPDFSRINPAKGLKRLFSLRLLIETFKNVLKLAVYGGLSWIVIKAAVLENSRSVTDASTLTAALAQTGQRLLAAFLAAAFLFAILDQLIARRDFLKRMRMSRRELRREHRDREGEPRMKQKRKQLHSEFAKLSQSLKGLKGADVLITNPTHIALALKYDSRTMVAPIAVSIGTDRLAQRLKRNAFLYSIPIIEDRALARELLKSCALNGPVPEHCFQAVAKIYNDLSSIRNPENPEMRSE